MSKTVSKFEIRSKKNKKTGVMEVTMLADGVKVFCGYMLNGEALSVEQQVTLNNGMRIVRFPVLANA